MRGTAWRQRGQETRESVNHMDSFADARAGTRSKQPNSFDFHEGQNIHHRVGEK